MDVSLDDLIKENPKKFSLKRGRFQSKPNKNPANTRQTKGNGPLGGVSRNGGRVTKQGGKQANGKQQTFKGNNNPNAAKKASKNVVVDARNKLLAKNRLKITDARDRIAAMAKKTDLRQKLSTKKPEVTRKPTALKTRSNQGIRTLVQDIGRGSLTRTIIGRTVENELARLQPMAHTAPHYMQPRYDLLPPPQFYPYHQTSPSYDLKHSTAAMDCEPPLSATKRISVAEKRLGPRGDMKSKPETTGHRIYVSNLHHKVTQEDIAELFGDVGPLVRASLQRPGVAEVVYVRRDDALRAVDVYHNRQLDGLPMHCSMGAIYEPRREAAPSVIKPRMSANSGKSHIAPDIGTIHKALFNKTAPRNSQIFTVTLPKKDA